MLPGKLLAATSEVIQYVGSVGKAAASEAQWDDPGEALAVLSVAQPGDLVVIAFTFNRLPDASWSWAGMAFTPLQDDTASEDPGAYVGYRIVQPGDANPYVTGVTLGYWAGLSIVASVFRNAGVVQGTAVANGALGNPNPPALTASAGLWVVTGHLDDDAVSMTAPTNYTLARSISASGGSALSTTAIAYRIAALSADDPGAFGGSGSDEWQATTIAFN